MWALFYFDERVSRLFPTEQEAVRAARKAGFFDGPRLIDDYAIKSVR